MELVAIAVDRGSYEDEETWLGACRIVNTAIQTALSTLQRGDESALQAARISRLDDLIQIIKDEEKKMPTRLLVEASL